MSRVLITGATGFIGGHCLPLLVEKGYEVHAVSRELSAELFMPNVEWHKCNLLAPGSAAEIINKVRPQHLLHLAWYAVPGKFWEAEENTDWMHASLKLFDEFSAAGGSRLIGAGSCSEYGLRSGECVEDRTPTEPATRYGICKGSVAAYLRSAGEKNGLDYAWARVFYPYGPHENPSRLVAYVVRSLLCGQEALCSDGAQTLDFIHVKDVAAAFVSLLESKVQGAVNIGTSQPVIVRAALQEIGVQTGRADLIRLGARAASAQKEWLWANTEKLRRDSDWKPQFDLVSGIEDTIRWWQRQLDGK